ncbi:hypothetical protein JW960_00640 [candidate division KSB1 bacterium]|nr:hypothetical protein [candidate division KSB1 bacterium]
MSDEKKSKKALGLLIVIILIAVVAWYFRDKIPLLPSSAKKVATISVQHNAVGDSLENTMKETKELFENNKYEESAKLLRNISSLLKQGAQKVDNTADQTIDATVDKLGKLADKLDAGTKIEVKELDRSLASAYLSLALQQQKKAASLWAEKKYLAAAGELKKASQNIKNAGALTGEKVQSGFSIVLEKIKEIVAATVSGTEKASDRASQQMKELGNDITQMWNNIQDE